MEREHLAAYVSGDLGPDETAAVEAALARDPQLRADVARLRRLDATLAALPDVEPRPGFDQRLRAAVADELEQLPFDELAARRAGRVPGRGLRRLGLAAAAAAVLGVVGVGVTQLVGVGSGDDVGDDSGDVTALDTADETAGSAEMAAAPPAGPLVVAEGRTVGADEIGVVVAGQDLFGRLAGPLSQTGDPTIVAETFRDLLLAPAAPDAQAEADAPTNDGARSVVAASLEVRGATPEQLEDVRRCLPAVLEAETAVIPLYAELLTYEGEPAILFVVASRDPSTGGYDRAEVWVLERASCQTRYFLQQ